MSLLTRFFGFFHTKQAPQSRLSPAESKQAVDKAYACCVDLHTCLGSLDDTQWIELSRRCSDLGFGFVDIPTGEGCPNDCAKLRDGSESCRSLSTNRSSEPSIVQTSQASTWMSHFESVARQVLNSTELPHVQCRGASDTLSSRHTDEPFSPPAFTDTGVYDSQSQVNIATDSALICQDSFEVPDNQSSYRSGETAGLRSTQGLQNCLIDSRCNSDMDGIGPPSANSANYHSQLIFPETAEVDFVDPSKIATFHMPYSHCCFPDGSPVGVTDHDRDVDQVMIDDGDPFPWSPTPVSVNSERATPGMRDRLDMSPDSIGFSFSPGPAVVRM